MSFDFNSINPNLSNVQASSKTTDGGGGNTGYFQRSKDEEKNMLEFAKDYPEDSFEHIELDDLQEEDDEESLLSLLKKMFSKLLNKIKKLF